MNPPTSTGLLVVIAAGSGTGKSTVCHKLLEQDPNVVVSVSYTTRAPRQGEENGTHYHFVDPDTFLQMRDQEQLLEWAQVHDRYYGTGRQATFDQLDQGRHVLLDIDVQGAYSIQHLFRERCVLIFLLPPSWDEMVRRLEDRGTETQERIQRRLRTAREEIPQGHKFDYLVVNDNLDETVQTIRSILSAEQHRATHMRPVLEALETQMNRNTESSKKSQES